MLHRLSTALLLSSLLVAPACGGDDDGGGGGGATDASVADSAPRPDSAPLIDAEPPPDGMPVALGCEDEPLPDTAADPVTVSGTVLTIDGLDQVPVQGATVTALQVSDDSVIVSDTTGADGAFALEAATGGAPIDAYLTATGNGYQDTRLYPPFPVTSNLGGIPVPLLTEDIFVLLYVISGNVQCDPELGTVLLIVTDCDLNPVAGATVASTPEAGAVVYGGDNGLPDANANATGAQGIVFLLNVPVAEGLVVQGEVNGQPLRAHAVATEANEVTATSLAPHAANL